MHKITRANEMFNLKTTLAFAYRMLTKMYLTKFDNSFKFILVTSAPVHKAITFGKQ